MTTPTRLTLFLTLAAAFGLAACSEKNHQNANRETASSASLTQLPVTVSYRERIMLPPTASVSVTLEDVSRMDVAATIIDKQTISTQGGPPYHLTLNYDASAIDPRMSYALRARIEQDGKLLFTNTSSIPAFKSDSAQPVDILVQNVARNNTNPPSRAKILSNSNWQATRLGLVESPKGAKDMAPSLSLQDGQASGFSGCNNFHGSYTLEGHSLKFGPLASTRKACFEDSAMITEQLFLEALAKVEGYSLNNGRLLLVGKKSPLIEFKVN